MKNWKTTSSGLTLIAGALISLWFKRHSLTEEIVMATVVTVIGGIGLLTAQDAKKK